MIQQNDAHNSTEDAILGDRSAFPSLRSAAYLNHAAIAPPSRWTAAAAHHTLHTLAQLGVAAFGEFVAQQHALKVDLARFIGAAGPEELALVPNTTHGVSLVALCFPWKSADRVLLVEGEFPANVTPWQRAAALHSLQVSWQPALRPHHDVAAWLAQLETALAGRDQSPPRVLAISAVQFQTGLHMPLKEVSLLCARYGVQLFVDAIQGCGLVPLDVSTLPIDYLACGCHKWMMGVPGLGMLYIRSGRAAALRPHLAGWTSHEQPFQFLFEGPGHLRYNRPIRKRADFAEAGMGNVVGVAAWHASLKPLLQLGTEAMFRHVDAYLDRLDAGLRALGFSSLRSSQQSGRSGLLCVQPPDDVPVIALHQAIDAGRVSCSTPDGALRFSPHWPNHQNEIAGVLQEIERALAKVRSGG